MIDTVATTAAKIEALLHPDAIILPNFPRSLQLDSYSCGAKSVYCILQYYGKRCTPQSVEKALHTDKDGTAVSDIKRVFKQYHLRCRTLRKPGLRELKVAINNGHPILITLSRGIHYVVIYGHSDGFMFISNPSLNILTGYGRIRSAIPIVEFREVWDHWGIVVSE